MCDLYSYYTAMSIILCPFMWICVKTELNRSLNHQCSVNTQWEHHSIQTTVTRSQVLSWVWCVVSVNRAVETRSEDLSLLQWFKTMWLRANFSFFYIVLYIFLVKGFAARCIACMYVISCVLERLQSGEVLRRLHSIMMLRFILSPQCVFILIHSFW